jgi:putative Mg2+ transporter-C (MgtC) family protein
MEMSLHPTWIDVAVRLALTMLAGAIIGFDRGVRGHAAGLRTTILVSLAASVGMILANLLLPLSGKTPESFGTMDVMRIPLGILTGVGFIGGGAIFRKGDLVTGVTTAATLWLMTVIGLCLGSGQLLLGTVATILAVVTLWALKWVEVAIPREHRALLVVTGATWKVMDELPALAQSMGYRARFQTQSRRAGENGADYAFEFFWRRPERASPPADLLRAVESRYRINSFELTSNEGR